MPEYLSTFPAGFEPLVPRALETLPRGARRVHVKGGIAIYEYDGDPARIKNIRLFTNTFALLARLRGSSFRAMIRAAAGARISINRRFVKPGARFRVRFWDSGRFVKVDEADMLGAERTVARATRMTLDRRAPQVEFWYIRRADGAGYYAMLYDRRGEDAKPRAGELRPELAWGVCLFAGVKPGARALDPFAGHGAIPDQLLAMNSRVSLHVSDIDPAMVKGLRARFKGRLDASAVSAADARALSHLADGSIDHIVTDPPWGSYDASITDLPGLYRAFLAEFRRVLAPGGRLTMLSGAREIARAAAIEAGFAVEAHLDLLVNGKKAGVYNLRLRE